MRMMTVCTLTLGLLSSGLAFASPATTAKAAPAVKHTPKSTAKIVTATGEVTAIDVAKKLLTIKETNSVGNFEILSSTQVTLADGKAGHGTDVKVGDHVTVKYDAHSKTLVAKSLKIG